MRKLCVAVLIVLGPIVFERSISSVRADQPTFEYIDFSYVDDFLSAFCGFPVEVSVNGKLINSQHGDTFSTRGAGYTVTFTNLDTGKYFAYKVAGSQDFSETVVGNVITDTFSFSGNDIHLVVPGQGDLVHQAGKVTDTFTLDLVTGEFSFTETVVGTQKGSLTDELVCQLLSD